MRVVSLLLASLLIAATAQAGEPEDEAAIRQIYRDWDAAVMRHDVNGVLAAHASDFVQVDTEGVRHDFESLKRVTPGQLTQFSKATSDTDVVEVVVKGDRAWATMKTQAKLWVPLSPDRSAKIGLDEVPIIAKVIGVDDWSRTPQGWQTTRTRLLMQTSEPDPAVVAQVKQRLAAQMQTNQDNQAQRFQQTLQYGAMLNCQTRQLQAMGWQRQGFMAAMPAC